MILSQSLTKVPMHIAHLTYHSNWNQPFGIDVMQIKRCLLFWIEEQDHGTEMNPLMDFIVVKEEHSPYFSVNDLTQESVIGGV